MLVHASTCGFGDGIWPEICRRRYLLEYGVLGTLLHLAEAFLQSDLQLRQDTTQAVDG